MFLKNAAARLITITLLEDGDQKEYPILPGDNPAVEVPDSAMDVDFVVAYIDNGSLIEVPAPKAEKSAKKDEKQDTKE